MSYFLLFLLCWLSLFVISFSVSLLFNGVLQCIILHLSAQNPISLLPLPLSFRELHLLLK